MERAKQQCEEAAFQEEQVQRPCYLIKWGGECAAEAVSCCLLCLH